jgi:PAS domain S-box-containing protein
MIIQTNQDRPDLEETSKQLSILEARYRRLFESARQGILIIDAFTQKIIDVNPSLAQFLSYDRVQILGKELREIGLFPDAITATEALRVVQEKGSLCFKHLTLITKAGVQREVELTSNFYEEDGHPFVEIIVDDVTDQKQTKEATNAASRQIISTWESMTDAFYSLDRNWRFTYVNSQATVQLQRSREDIIGVNIWEAFPEAKGTALEREYKRAATENIQVSFEEFYIPLQTWFTIHVYPNHAGLSVYFRDITESKIAEEVRQESDLLLRTLVESIPQIVWMARPDGRELFFNQKWFSFTGLTESERNNGGWARAIHLNDRGIVAQAWKQSVESGQPYEMEFRLRRADGVYRWMLGRAVPLRDTEGQSTRWFGTATDIQDLKQTKELMQQNESEQRVLVAQLATEQARLIAAQSVAKVGSWEIDFSTKREAWSAETYRILELQPRDFQPYDQAFLQFVHPDDREVMSQVLEASLGQRTPCTQEHRLLMPDGRIKIVEQRWQIFHDEQGNPLHAIGTIQDITERKHAQQELEAKTREITAIWESMTDALLTLDVNGNITHINSQAAILLRRSREELLGGNIWETFPEAINTLFYTSYKRAVQDQIKVDFEDLYAPLGIWLEAHIYPSQVGVSIYFRDITERRRAQEALKRSEQSLLRAQRIAQLGYMERDLSLGKEAWSDEIFRILGYEPHTFTSLRGKVSQHLHPDDKEQALQASVLLFTKGTPFNIEHRIIRPSGEVRWVKAQAEAMPDENGQMQFSCTWLDITERKQDEEEKNRLQAEIEEQQKRLDTIVATVPGVVWEAYTTPDSTDQHTVFVSDYVETMLGYTVVEWMETPNFWLSVMHPDDKEKALSEIDTIFASGKGGTSQFRWIARDGRTVWVESIIVVVNDDDGQPHGLRGVTIDITERKLAEAALQQVNDELEMRVEERTTEIQQANEALRIEGIERTMALEALKSSSEALLESQQRLQVVMNHIPQAIFWKDLNFAYVGCNYRLAKDAGYNSPEELIGKTDFDMPWAKYAADYQADDRQVMESGIPKLNIEEQLIKADGQIVWLRTNKIPLHNSENKVIGVLCSYEDITEQKESEASLIEARQEADAANHAKSEFLSRMSHELRTPLNAILGFGQILNQQQLSTDQQESVNYILKGGQHLLSLINEILDIARIESGHIELSIEPVSLGEVMAQVCSLMRPLANQRNILLINNVDLSSDDYVMADRQRLEQVIINLLSNAIKYNLEGGRVVVSASQTNNGRIRISILDTGIGMSSEDLQKLFVPFERLNAADLQIEGTGLGLVLSKRIIMTMKGRLTVESVRGEGSVFWIELPATKAPIKAKTEVRKKQPQEAVREIERSYTVLSIEDNPFNIDLLEAILDGRSEIKLLTAVQGNIGLELAHKHHPDLILLDLNLPGISGSEVLNRLSQFEDTKDIPIIVMSADATLERIESLLNAGARAYLTKPINVEEFLYLLDEVLLTNGNRI